MYFESTEAIDYLKYQIQFQTDLEKVLRKYKKSNPTAFAKLCKLLPELEELSFAVALTTGVSRTDDSRPTHGKTKSLWRNTNTSVALSYSERLSANALASSRWSILPMSIMR